MQGHSSSYSCYGFGHTTFQLTSKLESAIYFVKIPNLPTSHQPLEFGVYISQTTISES